MDPNHEGQVSFENYANVMWELEKGNAEAQKDFEDPNYQYEYHKKQFGKLLPKSGVYFLPDTRVVDFL